VAERYRALVDHLEESLGEGDVDLARDELRTLFGTIRVTADEREVRFETELRGDSGGPDAGRRSISK
jgi:hypothetical protein